MKTGLRAGLFLCLKFLPAGPKSSIFLHRLLPLNVAEEEALRRAKPPRSIDWWCEVE
jgi:hypothetical protein